MRPLGGRLDESEMLGSTPYTYYGGKGPPHLGTRCPTPRPVPFWGLRTQVRIPGAAGRQGCPPSLLLTRDVHTQSRTHLNRHTAT